MRLVSRRSEDKDPVTTSKIAEIRFLSPLSSAKAVLRGIARRVRVRERDTGAEAIFGGTCNPTTVAITDEAPVECGVLDAGPRLTWEKGSRAWGPPQSCYGIRTKSEDSTIPRVYEGRQDREVILRGLAVPGGESDPGDDLVAIWRSTKGKRRLRRPYLQAAMAASTPPARARRPFPRTGLRRGGGPRVEEIGREGAAIISRKQAWQRRIWVIACRCHVRDLLCLHQELNFLPRRRSCIIHQGA
jgi:hypothetical protein